MSRIRRIGSIELNEDMRFQKREWFVERIGWAGMLLVLVAMLAGLFGGGPLSRGQSGEEGGWLWANYERFPRWETRTYLEVHARALDADTMALSVSQDYLKHVMVESVTPEPSRVETGTEKTTFFFSGNRQEEPLVVRFHLEPERPGLLRGSVESGSGPAIPIRQLVFP